MTDKHRSASAPDPAAPAQGDAAAAAASAPALRKRRLAPDVDHRHGSAVLVPMTPALDDLRSAPAVAHCCRAIRRLVGELFELACMQQVLEPGAVRRPQCHVRQISMYLCRVVLSLSYGAIGRAMGRDRSTVVHACAAVEDRRDDRAYDAFVERCERCVLAVFATRESGHGEA
ncbi:DnaA-like protein [Hoeflea marina]|uniref:DnaA-like protein n=1 Tax=Hoeflea marina TaxID=274592 RepID=A0A317PN59_9HYPH|nr:helix-turn-helix domain-containing protein [Hoeflea marina]PWW02187.1 DnaA-like protein [Hoeflea marina]